MLSLPLQVNVEIPFPFSRQGLGLDEGMIPVDVLYTVIRDCLLRREYMKRAPISHRCSARGRQDFYFINGDIEEESGRALDAMSPIIVGVVSPSPDKRYGDKGGSGMSADQDAE